MLNSARSSLDEESVPGKPLTNAWGKQPNKRDKNTRNNDRQSPAEHRNKMHRPPRTKQRTFSHADTVEDLRSNLKEQQARNNQKTLERSRSVDMLAARKPNTSQGGGGGSLNDLQVEDIDSKEQVELWTDMETERSAASSKLLSREPKIRSEKPTTKPILLGK
jgi:hypothetical protein